MERVAGIKFKMSEYLQKKKKTTVKFISFNIKYLVFVVYSIEYKLKRICYSLHSIFIYVLHNVPTSLELRFLSISYVSFYSLFKFAEW